MRLKWADIGQYVPSKVGTVTVRHCQSKPKLYITKKEDGTILAHCFHCGAGGGWSPQKRDIGYIKDRLAGIEKLGKRVAFPHDYTTDINKWDAQAYAWVRKYGITAQEVEKYGLGYSSSCGSVVLPCYDAGRLLGIQYRRVHRAADEPKYVSYGYRGGFYALFAGVRCVDSVKHTVFIVEDVLSAIKCARTGADAIAILGTSLSDAVIGRLTTYKTFILYLDNDNPQVLRNRSKIAARLGQFGTVKVVDIRTKDPKELTTEQLEDILI